MSINKHHGIYSAGDIVGYSAWNNTFHGYKLHKKVYVDEVGLYVWLAQSGAARDNKFKIEDETFYVLKSDDIEESYHSTWTPDEKYAKGDILTGSGGMVFVYFSDTHVERLTNRPGLGQFGHTTLSDVNESFGPLTVHTVRGGSLTGINGKKFSEI